MHNGERTLHNAEWSVHTGGSALRACVSDVRHDGDVKKDWKVVFPRERTSPQQDMAPKSNGVGACAAATVGSRLGERSCEAVGKTVYG